MKPLVCLLIDDDAEEAEIFHYALEELNRPVKCVNVSGGKEAIAYLNNKAAAIDFIFMDLNMPRMNGMECLQQIKKLPGAGAIPIVLYSSSIFPKEQEQALISSGASAFLAKTASVFDLQNALFRIFASHEIGKLTVA